MKRIYIILLSTLIFTQVYTQSIAFMKMSTDYSNKYLDEAIITALKASGLEAKPFSNDQLFRKYNNSIDRLSSDQIANLKMFNHDYIILHKVEKNNLSLRSISKYDDLIERNNWQSEFYIFNINTNHSTIISLAISTFDCGNRLKSCSNIDGFSKAVKDFIQGNNSTASNNVDPFGSSSPNSVKPSQSVSENINAKASSVVSYSLENKFKVVRVKERNPANNHPIAVDIYDKNQVLKVGDDIVITRSDEVKIPGEKKTIKSETTVGKAKIIEAFNKPLYTAKLIANTSFNMKDYSDGDENYNAVKGESSKIIIAVPKIMVIPKKIDPSKFVNGEYQLSKEEKILIAAFKNKFEDNKFTTYGFESSIKSVIENRLFNDNIQEDIKSKILEASGMDFFVEYENLDQNNNKCEKVFDFKIRNYSTGEDIATDVKTLNSCGTPEDYKNFASTILNSGAVSKINTQFSSLLSNGRKVSVIFTISNVSQANFNKEYNGIKLKDHIENCLQGLAYNGNLDIDGVLSLRMEMTMNIPVVNENTGKSYTTNTFSEDIISYLKKNANIQCESSVSKQVVNIKIK